jgi:iron complex outermembrane receptor protein
MTTMKTRLLSAAAITAIMLGGAHAARAQSIDYGSLEQLFGEPVTTSATGSPQRSTEAPADMQIISADDIRRSGEVTIPGILQRAAGIDVLNTSVAQSDVNVRGLDQTSSPRLLVLINGRQVYQDHFGMTTWATLPVQLSEIRQIEVVKGPGAALFGFNAVSGVINIITYDPAYDAINVGSVRVGNDGQRQTSLVTTLKLGPAVSVRLSGGGSVQKEWAPTGALPPAQSFHDPSSSQANLDMAIQLAPKTQLRVEGSWSNVQVNPPTSAFYTVAKMLTTSVKGVLTSDTRFGLVQGSAYQNQLDVKYRDIGVWRNTIDVASVQDIFKIGTRDTFRISGEYRHNTLNSAPIAGGQVSYDVISASGLWYRPVTSQLTLTVAARVDDLMLHRSGTFPARFPLANNSYWDHDIVQPSVNVTGAWRPTASDIVRLSYARGVQSPALVYLGGIQVLYSPFPGFTVDVLSNPNLRPSIVVNYEAAFDHYFKTAKVGVRLFVQDWTDIVGDPVGAGGTALPPTATTDLGLIPSNVSNAEEKGVELNASGRLWASVNWTADYTYTTVKDSPFAGANAVANIVAFGSTTPGYRGNVGLNWAKGPWEADANLHYVGAYKFYGVVLFHGALAPVDAYGSLSARVGYLFHNGVTVALSGQNLLADRQKQTTGLEAERRWQFAISKAW